MARRIIIDTDPGTDDAVAMLLALAAAEALEVLGVVAVAGNLPLAATERNARMVCELAGRADLPVHAGCARPMLRPLTTAAATHGEASLGGVALPEPKMALRPQHGVDFLIETLERAEAGTVSLCMLGPLTDLAVALLKAPQIAGRIGEVALMGGACFEIGNITPAAEFNFHVDPHAAAIVLGHEIPITMVPLDVTHQALSTRPRLDRLRALGNRCGPLVAAWLGEFEERRVGRFGERGLALHDPCVVAHLLRPDFFQGRAVNVAVETESPLTAGMSVVDWWGVSGRPANVRLLHAVDAVGLFNLMVEKLARLP